ncbi:MAG: hypothetical protein AAB775_00990 [Patescibacteria group bacterium]
MSLFSPKAELSLVFDIGSSSVGAGLVRLARGETAQIIYSTREFFPYQEKVDPDRLFRNMIETLKWAHQKIISEGTARLTGTGFRHVNAKRMFYSFASPWSITQTKTLSVKKEKPFVFTHEFLNGLLLDEEEKFKRKAIESRGRIHPEALSVIERRIIQTRLNGYDVKDPFGKTAGTADISYFTSIVPSLVLDQTMGISHSSHTSKNVRAFAFPLIAYSCLKDIFQDESDFIYARVGGEISDVSIVEDGTIAESASFPGGQNPIIKKFAERTGMTATEAVSFLKLHAHGHAAESVTAKYQPILDGLMQKWVDNFRFVLKKLQGSMFPPRKVFLFMDGDLSHFFIKALREDVSKNFRNPAVSAVSFDAALFSADSLKPFLVWGDGVPEDSLIAVVSLFAWRVYQSKKK